MATDVPTTDQSAAATPEKPADTAWYRLPYQEVMNRLGSNRQPGLSSAEAEQRLQQYGPNEITERKGRTRWQILFEQFTNILTVILIAAAVISIFLGDEIEAIVILAIVALNGLLGFYQEYKAEQSMEALKRMSVPTVRVRRDGKVREVSARELVPGDIVLLETGNVVPADGRMIESVNLRAMEAALTGESEAVEKSADLVLSEDRVIGDQRNMLFSGTVVNYGHGEMIVTGTGMETELGHIADMIQSVSDEQTPLQQRLDGLGKILAIAAIILVVVIFVMGVLQGNPVEEMLLTAVSLAVAAIPEALTAVVTIALSLGAQRMLRRKALIRKLPAVETLGSVSIICSDKTGTLTQNRMTVMAIDIAEQHIELAQPEHTTDRFDLEPIKEMKPGEKLVPTLDLLLMAGALNNDAQLEEDADHPGEYHAIGDPTEGALVLAAAEYGIFKSDLEQALPRKGELPFDSVRKRMTTIHKMPADASDVPPSLQAVWERRVDRPLPRYLAITKGAIDGLMEHADRVWINGDLVALDNKWRARIMRAHDEMAGKGMRVLAAAIRGLDELPAQDEIEDVEERLVLVGLFGMIDPPRPEVTESVATCRKAGIRPVMITGDHPLTARHIAQQIGITESDEFVTGQELESMSEAELTRVAHTISVFARVSPEHKLRLIEAYQKEGSIVAMTGDGVNDAPALKKSDIGVAMGITGTDVSKEAADMILLDDNFATIVSAVEEGRTVYDNIRKFIKYLLSCNTSEIAVMLIGPFMGLPLPLLPLQILWMNLVTDGLPALALGVEPAERSVMRRPPYSSQESIFGRGMAAFIIVLGVVMSIISLTVGVWAYRSGDPAWQTLLFTTLIFAQIVLALEVRSERDSLFTIGFFSNPPMVWAFVSTLLLQILVVYVPFFQNIFHTDPLSVRDVAIAFGASLFILIFVEVWKIFLRREASNE
ncbi:MAG: cation-translocating P-type ATPase [Caldilineaceae bacterium]|nr:cation-translocating P-type ATPase [Caldilineaceae bacterium]